MDSSKRDKRDALNKALSEKKKQLEDVAELEVQEKAQKEKAQVQERAQEEQNRIKKIRMFGEAMSHCMSVSPLALVGRWQAATDTHKQVKKAETDRLRNELEDEVSTKESRKACIQKQAEDAIEEQASKKAKILGKSETELKEKEKEAAKLELQINEVLAVPFQTSYPG